MLAQAALLLAIACLPAHTHAHADNSTNFSDVLDRALAFAFGDSRWPRRIAECTRALGPNRCLAAFSSWRAEYALDSYEKYGGCETEIVEDLNKFPWEKYANVTADFLDGKLSDNTVKLLQLRSLKFSMLPGYRFELDVRKNGALNVDVYKISDDDSEEANEVEVGRGSSKKLQNEVEVGRGSSKKLQNEVEVGRGSSKKLQKRFYAIMPYLLIPGLMMSAILPFVLPSLKMMTMGVGMLNQMALTGAIFTLLRNNAFNDYYEKKVIYLNKGYKNEKHAPIQHHIEEEIHEHSVDDGFYSDVKGHDSFHEGTNHYEQVVEQEPSDADWINQYYGGEGFGQVIGHGQGHNSGHGNNRRSSPKRRTRLKNRY